MGPRTARQVFWEAWRLLRLRQGLFLFLGLLMQIPALVWDAALPISWDALLDPHPADLLVAARWLPALLAMSAIWLWLSYAVVTVVGSELSRGTYTTARLWQGLQLSVGPAGRLFSSAVAVLLLGTGVLVLPSLATMAVGHLLAANDFWEPSRHPLLWGGMMANATLVAVLLGLVVGGVLLVAPVAHGQPSAPVPVALRALGQLTQRHVWLLATSLLVCQGAVFAADLASALANLVSLPLGLAMGLLGNALAAPLAPLCGVVLYEASRDGAAV